MRITISKKQTTYRDGAKNMLRLSNGFLEKIIIKEIKSGELKFPGRSQQKKNWILI